MVEDLDITRTSIVFKSRLKRNSPPEHPYLIDQWEIKSQIILQILHILLFSLFTCCFELLHDFRLSQYLNHCSYVSTLLLDEEQYFDSVIQDEVKGAYLLIAKCLFSLAYELF